MENKNKKHCCDNCKEEHNHYHYLLMGGVSYEECEKCCKTCKKFKESIK